MIIYGNSKIGRVSRVEQPEYKMPDAVATRGGGKQVVIDGELYRSITQAATAIKCPRDSLADALNAGHSKYAGHIIAYARKK